MIELSPALLREVVKGAITRLPGWQHLWRKRGGEGTASASYCYSVWLKHLTLLHAGGMQTVPERLGELGPGHSLGVGLAAMLSGVNHYVALDMLPYATNARDLEVFEQLVEMFRQRAGRPTFGWPDFDQYLDQNLFPSAVLSDEVLEHTLAPERLDAIRRVISGESVPGLSLRYCVPWHEAVEEGAVDVILSHSVLEHVDDLATTYAALHRWLRSGGLMSHQIDLTAHAISGSWDGYRTYPDWLWWLVRGKRPYLINRTPPSEHVRLMEQNGFTVVRNLQRRADAALPARRLARRWRHLAEDDRFCDSAFIQAQKSSQTD